MNSRTIFIETKNIENNIDTFLKLSFFLEKPKFSFWFYPEATNKNRDMILNKFQKFYFQEMMLERVTTYYDDTDTMKKNILFLLNDESKILVTELFQAINSVCDSIIVYADNSPEWKICNIFHENIFLIKDRAFDEEILNNHALRHSLAPPKWW